MDMTARLSRAYAGDHPEDEVCIVDFDKPIKSGIEGPQISTSMIPVCVILMCESARFSNPYMGQWSRNPPDNLHPPPKPKKDQL